MLYIFDLGNVIVDIDFNRVLGAWSDFSRVPLATLKQNFAMGETFHLHERGEISDEAFAERFCQENRSCPTPVALLPAPRQLSSLHVRESD